MHGAHVTFVCLHPPNVFEVRFVGGCAEGGIAGSGMATSAGDTSVELEDPLVNHSVNGCSHSGNSVTTLRSWSPTACVRFKSSKALVWCSVACTPGTTKGMWLSVSHSIFSLS